MPTTANGNVLDWRINRAGSLNLELERQVRVLPRPGRLRLLAFRNVSKAPTYRLATQQIENGQYNPDRPLILFGTDYGGVKYGFGLNAEQPLSAHGGLFGRTSWNDGRTATWAFTEIDRSYSLGGTLGGARWRRPNDQVGLALVRNDLSPDHAAFLAAGGRGFMLGDGRLPHYAGEHIVEALYNARLAHFLWLTADYQLIFNPGYNADRGPVNLFALRTHVEM
jgi:high affinity Mn2+ porin